MDKKKVTMKDIAARAGVTQATVSYVINNTAKISPAVKKKVNDAIRETGYIPNAFAKGLKTKKSNIIGLIVPNVAFSYYSHIVAEAEQVFNSHGYALFLCNTKYMPSLEQRYLNILQENNVEGILFCGGLMNKSLYDNLDIPYVCIEENIEFQSRRPNVYVNHELGVRMMISHLCQVGARRIAYVHVPMDYSAFNMRLQYYNQNMDRLGLKPEVVCVQIPQTSYFDSGYEIAHLFLPRIGEIDAIYAETDAIATGISVYFKEKGIRIPEDVMLVGYDGDIYGRISSPPITTIDQDLEKLGNESAHMLVNIIGGEPIADDLVINPTLIVRESTKVLHKERGG
jgi:LacI family transcriptional regulator